jgi:hypothetical protein
MKTENPEVGRLYLKGWKVRPKRFLYTALFRSFEVGGKSEGRRKKDKG